MQTSRWRGQMLLSSAIMTSCSLVCEHHYTEVETALNYGSYDTTCTGVSEEPNGSIFDGHDPAYNLAGLD
jgi:hypothetical protein